MSIGRDLKEAGEIYCLSTPTACSAAWVHYDLMHQGPWLFKAIIPFAIQRAVPLESIKESIPMAEELNSFFT